MYNVFKKFDLTGKSAFVTGGGSGMGYFMARSLSAAGARVMIAARREDVLSDAAERLTEETGNPVLHTTIDLADRQHTQNAAMEAVEALGGVDIFVGNAAQDGFARLDVIDEADVDHMFQVNVTSNITLTKAFLPHMRANKWGRIIYSSSIVVYRVSGQEGMTSYAASKSALSSLARSTAVDMGHEGITANAMVLGAYKTDMLQAALDSMPPDVSKEVTRSLVSQNALGRFGDPEDVEGIVLLLASEAGRFITGADITVDGGWRVVQKANVPPWLQA